MAAMTAISRLSSSLSGSSYLVGGDYGNNGDDSDNNDDAYAAVVCR